MGLLDLISGKSSQERFASMVAKVEGIECVDCDAEGCDLNLNGIGDQIVNLGMGAHFAVSSVANQPLCVFCSSQRALMYPCPSVP